MFQFRLLKSIVGRALLHLPPSPEVTSVRSWGFPLFLLNTFIALIGRCLKQCVFLFHSYIFNCKNFFFPLHYYLLPSAPGFLSVIFPPPHIATHSTLLPPYSTSHHTFYAHHTSHSHPTYTTSHTHITLMLTLHLTLTWTSHSRSHCISHSHVDHTQTCISHSISHHSTCSHCTSLHSHTWSHLPEAHINPAALFHIS